MAAWLVSQRGLLRSGFGGFLAGKVLARIHLGSALVQGRLFFLIPEFPESGALFWIRRPLDRQLLALSSWRFQRAAGWLGCVTSRARVCIQSRARLLNAGRGSTAVSWWTPQQSQPQPTNPIVQWMGLTRVTGRF